MSLFPNSPTNGQTVTVNNITYTYDSAQTAWIRTGATSVGYVFDGGSPTSNYSVGPAFDCGGVT
jgi:hypothetical protein